MINKTKTKKIFHDNGVQININALNMMEMEVRKMLDKWALNCKNGNVKRLTPELMYIAFGRQVYDME